ncbi:ABC transporter permease [Agromyces sp. MMS24-JH15]|uniref:ABC transporter permease n=1 Tax=Agromyces sp. MMS24-JH15 TaxID=3243765 RepID=UPI003748BD72
MTTLTAGAVAAKRAGRGSADRTVGLRIVIAVGRRAVVFVAVSALIVVLWWAFLLLSGVSPFVGKTPLVVWEYLVTGPEAEANRALIAEGLAITAQDAAIGYLAGLGGATIVAIGFALLPAAATTFMPVAMVLRTFPLVALTPLIILAFGRGTAGLAAIGFIVVFFASLVTISFGIASASREALDVVGVFGGRRFAQVMKIGVPSALPAFFTAARIAIPQALSAALIAEWLVTGSGSGSQLMRAAGTSQYDTLWTVAVVLIAVATLVYTLVSAIEEIFLARFGDA